MLRVTRPRVLRPEFNSFPRVCVGESEDHPGTESRKQSDRADDGGGRAAEAVVGERFSLRSIRYAGDFRRLRETLFEARAAVAELGGDDFARRWRTVRRANVTRGSRLRDDRREGRGGPGRLRLVGSERRANFHSEQFRGEFEDGEGFHEVMRVSRYLSLLLELALIIVTLNHRPQVIDL